jgi:hypothetical protein
MANEGLGVFSPSVLGTNRSIQLDLLVLMLESMPVVLLFPPSRLRGDFGFMRIEATKNILQLRT